ncbi:hypothetical protein [Paraburkholderia sartisoli]|uniref:Uncharacterized protein n=1 Tax=Paraburkholderia sartisoli TaxID=83784 RepID=A0A1H4G6L6_9BURK|nr:hypothetical protein [Paraburkholderia sartisoli]SEB04941.1 hypothetical protein SAMN05192564_105331 [Paraburkholderia sartisoli]
MSSVVARQKMEQSLTICPKSFCKQGGRLPAALGQFTSNRFPIVHNGNFLRLFGLAKVSNIALRWRKPAPNLEET